MVVAILCVKSKSYKYKGERSNIVHRVVGKGGKVIPTFEGLDANFIAFPSPLQSRPSDTIKVVEQSCQQFKQQ